MIKKNSLGFSLTEVLIVIALAALVLTFGIPNFQTSIKNSYKKTAMNDLRTALSLARNTAISRRTRVTVCKSGNATSCAAGGDWKQGWIVFFDPDDIGVLNEGDGEEILRVHGRLDGNGTFSGNDTVANRVSFKPQGMADGSVGTISYFDGNNFSGSLVISFGGLVRSE